MAEITACYSLRTQIANWEFYNWLVLVAAKGATKILFDISNPKTSKWSAETVLRRFHSIIEPGPALLGLTTDFGAEQDASLCYSANVHALLDWVRAGNQFPRLRTTPKLGAARYTVTIRQTEASGVRNSNQQVWRQFAAEIGATVIEDYNIAPITLLDRFALYAAADMNFGVANGPIHALTLSNYPVMLFCHTAEREMLKGGIARGEQYPWLGERQFLMWEPVSIEMLRSVWRRQCAL